MAWLPKKRIVVPIDFSGQSVDAIHTARELVENASDVHALHVVQPLDNMAPGIDWGNIDDASREQAVRDHIGEFLNEHGIKDVTPVPHNGCRPPKRRRV